MNVCNLLIFRRSTILCKKYLCTPPASSSNSAPNNSTGLHQRYSPSNFQKTILVWTKKYKNKEEIPQFVSAELIERSRSEARIKISNILIVLTALASLGAIFAGKAAAKRGESVHQMNLDWHKQYEEEQNAKESALAKK